MQGRGVRSASPRNAYQERRTQAQVSIDTNKDKMNPKKEVRVGIARGADQKKKAYPNPNPNSSRACPL